MTLQWFEIELKGKNKPIYFKSDTIKNAEKEFLAQKKKETYSEFDKSNIVEIRKSDKVAFNEVVSSFPHANYCVDVAWDYLEETLKHYEQYNLDLEPDFQRNHVWTEEQQVAFVEYSIRGGMSGRDIFFNDPSWENYKNNPELVLVDGLQRLTAVRKFMRNELKIFGKYTREDFQYLNIQCRFKFHINNLQTRKEVLRWYLDFNSGGTIHTEKELDKVRKLLRNEQ
jgi:hypothetical protein